MRRLQTVLAILILAGPGLSACATPDIKAFSDQTAALQVAVVSENQEIVKQYDTITGLTELGEQEGWFAGPILPGDPQATQAAQALKNLYAPRKWQGERMSVLKITREMDGLMGDLTAYTTSLANLAAQGETGRESVDKALGSLKKIAEIANVGMPGLSTVAINAARELGDLVTRAQAQYGLDEAMSVITASGGAQKVATIIEAFSRRETELVASLRRDRVVLERYKVGPDLVAFYNREHLWHTRDRAFALLNLDSAARAETLRSRTEAQLYTDLLKCYALNTHGCPRTSAVSGLASSQLLLRAIADDVRGYIATRDAILAWQKAQSDKLTAITKAAKVWAVEHDQLAAYLHECAGLRVFKARCGAYSAAKLKAAAERISGLQSSSHSKPSTTGD